jgi:hypothetical protein
MRRLAPILALLVVTGCSASRSPPAPGGRNSPTMGLGALPSPGAPISMDPRRLAGDLARVNGLLEESVRAWVAHGATSPPPTAVALLALYQQRIYGTLAAHPGLNRAVVALLPPDLARTAEANVVADRRLGSLSGPPSPNPPRIRTHTPPPVGTLLGFYKEAQRRFHVAWPVLAAVNLVESRFDRVVSASSAGAQGPMQFIAATWAAYGLGGDVHDPHDAILGAANYLSASGAPADYRRALYAYNPSTAYVAAVLAYAHQMMGDPLLFYEYYNWQVFVATPTGDRQITGPGTGE